MDIIDIGLIVTYVLLVVSTVAAIVMPIVQAFGNPSSLIKSGIGFGGLVVLFLVAYMMGNPVADGVSETTSKWVDAGIFTSYAALFVAIFGIVYTEIIGFLK